MKFFELKTLALGLILAFPSVMMAAPNCPDGNTDPNCPKSEDGFAGAKLHIA